MLLKLSLAKHSRYYQLSLSTAIYHNLYEYQQDIEYFDRVYNFNKTSWHLTLSHAREKTYNMIDKYSSSNINESAFERIVALDYLRVIAIGILFFYHLGMIWVPDWGFHFKQETNWYWLQHTMMLSSPWRMGLLWFISGTSLYMMQRKYGSLFLITHRSNAILLPLLFGMLFVVPVQLYVEMTQSNAINTSLGDFFYQFLFGTNDYFENFDAGVWHHIDVNHLWFLRSLWRFTLILVILHYPITLVRNRFKHFNITWLVLFVIASLGTMFVEDSDLSRDLYGFVCLLFGFLFGASVQFWEWVKRHFSWIILCTLVLIFTYEVTYYLMRIYPQNDAWMFTTGASYYIAKIVSLLAVIAIAQRLFVKPSAFVSKANSYVFPLYILHQSVIVGVAFYISGLSLSNELTALGTMIVSFIICAALLLATRNSALLGLVLGKKPPQSSCYNSTSAKVVIAIVTLPLALRLVGLI